MFHIGVVCLYDRVILDRSSVEEESYLGRLSDFITGAYFSVPLSGAGKRNNDCTSLVFLPFIHNVALTLPLGLRVGEAASQEERMQSSENAPSTV